MELGIRNGEYTLNEAGELARVAGRDEAIQRVMLKLAARRGGFALLPEYGSRLYTLYSYKPSQRETMAKQFIAEALEDETDFAVNNIGLTYDSDGLIITLNCTISGEDKEASVVISQTV